MWSSIQQFVMSWQDSTFILVFCILGICLLYGLVMFIQKAYGSKKGNKIRWGIVVAIVVLGLLMAVLAAARWA